MIDTRTDCEGPAQFVVVIISNIARSGPGAVGGRVMYYKPRKTGYSLLETQFLVEIEDIIRKYCAQIFTQFDSGECTQLCKFNPEVLVSCILQTLYISDFRYQAVYTRSAKGY